MDRLVKITTRVDGKSHVGVPVCEGPKTYRLMLTWPYSEEGRIVEIPLRDIESVAEARGGPLKEPPVVLETENGEPVPGE